MASAEPVLAEAHAKNESETERDIGASGRTRAIASGHGGATTSARRMISDIVA
jgi:hypothetical protein